MAGQSDRTRFRCSSSFPVQSHPLSPDSFNSLLSSLSSAGPDVYDSFAAHFRAVPFTSSPSELNFLQNAITSLYSGPFELTNSILSCMDAIISSDLSTQSDARSLLISSAISVAHGADLDRAAIALNVLCRLTSQNRNLLLSVFSVLDVGYLVRRIVESGHTEVQYCGVRLFHNLARVTVFPMDLAMVFLSLCRAIADCPGHSGLSPAFEVLREQAIHEDLRELMLRSGVLEIVNMGLEEREGGVLLAALRLLKELLNSDWIADDVNLLAAIRAMGSPDEEIVVASCDVVAKYIRKYPASIPVMAALDVGGQVAQVMVNNSVKAKVQAICILTNIVKFGDTAAIGQCVTEEMIGALWDSMDVVPVPMKPVVQGIFARLIASDIKAGRQLGVCAALAGECVQSRIAAMTDAESEIRAPLLDMILETEGDGKRE
jgi:hypothetical protein